MEKVHELSEGKVCVLGAREGVAAVMGAILSSPSDVPAIVLCREGSPASGCAGEGDRVILAGRSSARGEAFPDLLAPFLASPFCGPEVESIVEALSDVLSETLPPRSGNDAYWVGNAGRLFRGILLSCLTGMHHRGDFSFANFAANFRRIFASMQAMVSHDLGGRGGFTFPEEDWAVFRDPELGHPLEEPVIKVHPSTAQITLNTLYSQTGRFADMMKSMPEDCRYFDLGAELERARGGALYLVFSRDMGRFSSVLLPFILGGLAEHSAARGDTPLRVIIPDASEWGDLSFLGKILDASPDGLSLIWGASSLAATAAGSERAAETVFSLVARCDSRAWLRSGDPTASGAYRRLVPEPLRAYELTSIPPGLCFIQTPSGEFDGVAVPEAPGALVREAGPAGKSPELWRDRQGLYPREGEEDKEDARFACESLEDILGDYYDDEEDGDE